MPFAKGYIPWNKNKKLSKKTRLKMRNSTLGFKHSAESIEKCSLSKMGNKNPNFGKITSEKTRKKISKANKGRKMSEEHRKKLYKMTKQRAIFLKGKTLEQIYGDKKGKEIRKKLSDACSKEKNGNWKEGVSTESRIIRGGKKTCLWREAVFKKNNWICQKCSQRGSIILNAHHIKSFSKFPKLRFEIDNGITFCKKCHEKFHKLYGRSNAGIAELIKFINN